MQRFILRVLTGPNAGAEALLGERTTIGSAETDDIMIGDGALSPGHFTIEVKGGAINVVVGDAPLAIKDEFKPKGSYPVKPFDPIKFGATCCAVGPEGVDWPALKPTDLLPVAQPPAEEPPAPEASTASSPAEEPAAPLPAPAPQPIPANPRRTRIVVWAAAAAVVLLLLAGGVYLIEREDEAVAEAGQKTVEQIVAAQDIKGVTVRADGSDGLIVEGFVPTNDQQRRLRQALQETGIAVRNRVVSLEQQVSAARTIASAAGMRLAIEGDPQGGKIMIDGFVSDAAQLEAIVRSFRRDIADLRPLQTRVVSPETLRSEVAEKLRAAGLEGQINLEVAGNVIRIRGALTEEGRKAATRVAEELNDRWQGMAKVEIATTSSAAPAPVPIPGAVTVKASPPPAKFVIIVGGREGFVRDDAGRRYSVGDKLANGEVIEEIRVEEVITSRDGIRYRYTFGGGK